MTSAYLPPDSEALRLAPGMRRVVVDTDSAGTVKDLASLRRDIQLATTFLHFYLNSDIENEAAMPSQIDALWIAAITMYGRAFASGQRHFARPDTDSLDVHEAANHEYFIDLRNKYIAHPVNGFERSTVFADITDLTHGAPGIAQVGEVHVSLSRISRERAESLKRLCHHHIEELTARIEELHQKIARELVALDQEAVYGLNDYTPAGLDGTDPRSKRK